jgi:hypothetical protein
MVTRRDLETRTFVDLYEFREVWYISQSDMYGSAASPGAETRIVGEDISKGVFSSMAKAKTLERERESQLQRQLRKGDQFDKRRIATEHKVEPGDCTDFGFALQIIPYSVPIEQLTEEKGEMYWNRPKQFTRGKPADGSDTLNIKDSEESRLGKIKKHWPVLWKYTHVKESPEEKIKIS